MRLTRSPGALSLVAQEFSGTSSVWVAESAGGTPRQPAVGPSGDPAWSPDGKRIAFWFGRNPGDESGSIFTTTID